MRALESLLGHDLDVEVIVIDDASEQPFVLPDELVRLLKVRVLRNAKNLGAAAARSQGIAAAGNEWITFLNSDDTLVAGTLRSRFTFARSDFMRRGRALTCYACAHRGVDANGQPCYVRYPQPAASIELFAGGCWFCPGSAVLMRREAALLVGPQNSELRRLEDFDWFLRLALLGLELVCDPTIGVSIDIGHRPSVSAVDAASAHILRKWGNEPLRSSLSARAWRRLQAYLLLVRASAHWYARARLTAMALLAASYLAWPRLHMHPSPAWSKRPISLGY